MFQNVKMVIEQFYTDRCTVTVHQKSKFNGVISFNDITCLTDVPCRLSIQSNNSATHTDVASAVGQTIKLFLAPHITIASGSKITVNGVDYTRSGVPAVYETHQEIVLELFKGWS